MTKPAPRVGILLKAWAALLLLLLASCAVETPSEDILYEVGAVEGYVLVGGQGVPLTVSARLLRPEGDWTSNTVRAETRSDSTGWYRLEMPVGRYLLFLHSSGSGNSQADTVQIEPVVLRHDLRRGQAMVRLRMPLEWEGLYCDLRLDNVTNNYYGRDGDGIEDGWAEFVMPALEPGAYVMEFTPPNSYDSIYLPGTLDAAEADTLVVGLDAVAGYERDFTGTYITISGRVTGSWQVEPALGVRVAAHATESLEVAADICDGEGRFQLIQLAPLDVRLRFSCNGLSRWHGGVSFGTAEQFALQAGDRITGVDVVESGIEIRLDGPGDLEQREVRIRICDETGSVLASTESTHNPILIGNLLPGRILLQLDGVCNEQTWAGQWFDGAVSPAGATPIDLVAGERRRIDVVLAPGGLIAGVVLQAGGSAPASVHVAVCSDSGAPLCSWPSYSYDGEFLFNGLADGDYLLKVDLGGGGAWWYPGTYEIDHAAAIGIVDHGAVTGLSWTLPASTAGARR